MEVKIIKANTPTELSSKRKIERLRVAAYCRVSTDDEDQTKSYQSMIKYYTDLIQNNKQWVFAGIFADKAITPGQEYSAIKDGGTVTLYALYNVDDFTLSFDANGGTGKLNSVTHKGNQSYALPVNTFTRIGYEFRGWSFDKYTDTISYKNGATYDNRLISATLYAQWKKTGTGFIQRPFLDSDMFYKAISILGNNGTVYNKNSVDSRMAHIDTANNPGYFSLLK